MCARISSLTQVVPGLSSYSTTVLSKHGLHGERDHQWGVERHTNSRKYHSGIDSKDEYNFVIQISHTPNYAFKCSLCEKSYSRKDRLGMHMRNVHNGETSQVKRRFECPFSCGSQSSFRTMMSFLQHCERVHEHLLGEI